jgi:hypothetical protein
MKKLLFALLVCIASLTSFAQKNMDEETLTLKPADLGKIAFEKGNVDCKCSNNILLDGGFQNLTASGSNISSSSTPWQPGFKTPQWSNTIQPACDKGVVSMWGNKTVGESIFQTGLTIAPGCYTVKFTARFVNPTSLSTFVRLKFATVLASGAPAYDPPGVASVNISSTSWQTYSFTFTTGAATTVNLHPENDYTQNDGAYVSWIQLDNICIEKCCKIPDEKCNPNFSAAAFTVNAQGNVIINVNPVITAGAQHYWGLLGASGIGDNTAIPLSTITSGSTFGLAVSSTGVAAPVGMGTLITASTSGYGYCYQGVDVGKCFKITHYIKCCSKWYSQTNTYCTKLCSEVKEGAIIELSDKEAEKAEAVQAGQGKG